jgi:hypothetical protein
VSTQQSDQRLVTRQTDRLTERRSVHYVNDTGGKEHPEHELTKDAHQHLIPSRNRNFTNDEISDTKTTHKTGVCIETHKHQNERNVKQNKKSLLK